MADTQYQTQTRTDSTGSSYDVRVPVGVPDDYGNVISSATLAPKPPITPATPTPDTTNYSGITGGVTQSIMDSYKTFNDQQIAAQGKQQDTGQSILDYMKKLEGKTADTQAANDATGVTAETENLRKYAGQLADLNAQASSLNREAQAVPIQVQQNNQGTGATDAGVAPQSAAALRLNALKALSIGQQSDIAAAAATGSQLRLDAAKDKAKQIIDLKYKPIEDEIALKQKQYDLNKDVLESIDKKRSEALQVALTKEASDLADKKAQDKSIQDLMIEAAKAGADSATLDNIKKSTNVSDAIRAAGTILGKQQSFDNYIKTEQLKLQQAQIEQGKYQLQQTGSHYDEDGNEVKEYGIFNPKTGTVTALSGDSGSTDMSQVWGTQYPTGTSGPGTGNLAGQCAVFAESIVNLGTPNNTIGDLLKQKQQNVDKYGIDASTLRATGPQVGDALVFNIGKYGHIAVVNKVLGNGQVQLSESNYNNDGKVNNSRIVNINDANVYGAFRGQMKNVAPSFNDAPSSGNSPAVDAYAAQYASTGQIPAGMKVPFAKVAAAAKELPKPTGTLVDMNTGIKPAKLTADQQTGIASLYDIVNNKLPMLLDSANHIDRSPVGKLGSVFYTTQNRQNFETARNEILNLLLKARSGSAVSDNEYARYVAMMPREVSLSGNNNSTISLGKSLSDTLSSVLKTNGLSIYGYSTTNVGGKSYKVGDVLQNDKGQSARVNPDGTLTILR